MEYRGYKPNEFYLRLLLRSERNFREFVKKRDPEPDRSPGVFWLCDLKNKEAKSCCLILAEVVDSTYCHTALPLSKQQRGGDDTCSKTPTIIADIEGSPQKQLSTILSKSNAISSADERTDCQRCLFSMANFYCCSATINTQEYDGIGLLQPQEKSKL